MAPGGLPERSLGLLVTNAVLKIAVIAPQPLPAFSPTSSSVISAQGLALLP